MIIPDDIETAAEEVLTLADVVELMDQAEGSLCMVAADNYYKLLSLAENLARFILQNK